MILKGITILPKQRKTKGYQGSNDPFYISKEWKSFRLAYLTKHPLCKICTEPTEAIVLDHIQPIKQGGSVWSEYNLQGLCRSCNAKKTALDNPNNQ